MTRSPEYEKTLGELQRLLLAKEYGSLASISLANSDGRILGNEDLKAKKQHLALLRSLRSGVAGTFLFCALIISIMVLALAIGVIFPVVPQIIHNVMV